MTAEAMQALQDDFVVDADVVSGNLILTKDDGSTINAGPVVGSPGPSDLGSVVWLNSSYDASNSGAMASSTTPVAGPAFETSSPTTSSNATFRYTTDNMIRYVDVNEVPFFKIDCNGQDTCMLYYSGLYYISYSVSLNTGAASRRAACINVNGVEVTRAVVSSASYSNVSVEWYGYLNPNDKISFSVFQDSGDYINYATVGTDVFIMSLPVYS